MPKKEENDLQFFFFNDELLKYRFVIFIILHVLILIHNTFLEFKIRLFCRCRFFLTVNEIS